MHSAKVTSETNLVHGNIPGDHAPQAIQNSAGKTLNPNKGVGEGRNEARKQNKAKQWERASERSREHGTCM
jgi:hypothetical protein